MTIAKIFSDAGIHSSSPYALITLFRQAFELSKKFPNEPSQLEFIAEELSTREFSMRLHGFNGIKRDFEGFISSQRYESAAIYRDMLLYYNVHVL